jgi:hypothetical protein
MLSKCDKLMAKVQYLGSWQVGPDSNKRDGGGDSNIPVTVNLSHPLPHLGGAAQIDL